LSEKETIALTDVAGSLQELVVLALRAKEDNEVWAVFEAAVGRDVAVGVVDFWSAEYPVD
jgi:hypothetical protein